MIWDKLTSLTKLLPGETSHQLALATLSLGMHPRYSPVQLPGEVAGLHFYNPVGLAAGFDKNAKVMAGCFALGFGSVEIGTVTPLPQPGNPKPRVFRLPEDNAFINRYGFNSHGMEVVALRLSKWRSSKLVGQILGVNIGANRASKNKIEDYYIACSRLAGLVDYVSINISSPNTIGIRDLQKSGSLEKIIESVKYALVEANLVKPIFVKLSPDLNKKELFHAIEIMVNEGVSGVIMSNTTVSRFGLKNMKNREQDGGLSGEPLFRLSCEKLSEAYSFAAGKIAFIGVGGISTASDAYTKILLGADILQLYSSLAINGPHIVNQINTGLVKLCLGEGLKNLKEACGIFNSFDKANRYAEHAANKHLKNDSLSSF